MVYYETATRQTTTIFKSHQCNDRPDCVLFSLLSFMPGDATSTTTCLSVIELVFSTMLPVEYNFWHRQLPAAGR